MDSVNCIRISILLLEPILKLNTHCDVFLIYPAADIYTAYAGNFDSCYKKLYIIY